MITRALDEMKLWSTETCSSRWSCFYNTHSCFILLIFLSEILFSWEFPCAKATITEDETWPSSLGMFYFSIMPEETGLRMRFVSTVLQGG